MVVPIFAPIVTAIDWVKLTKPAFTKLTSITVVAEEDCISEVTNKPVKNPALRLAVITPNTCRSLLPVAFCKDSLSIFMP